MGFLLTRAPRRTSRPSCPRPRSPASHCGSGAARQSPEVFSAVPCRKIGPQAAVSQPAYLPFARPWYHLSLKSASMEMRSCWIRSVQYDATSLASSLLTLMLTVSLPS